MKNHLLKLVFVVACLGFMSSGCEKENNEPLLVQDQALTPTIVSLKEIPDIEKFLNDNIFGFQNREFDERSAIYDESNIIKLIDKEGNHNYSISFMYEDTPITTFHNLIIYKPIVGKINSHVVRYESNQLDQETFLAKKLDFNYYIGTAYIEGVNSVDSRGENPAGRDVNTPCPETVITFGGIGTGTGPNTNNGTVINSNASVTSTSSPFGGSYSYSPTGGGGSFSIGGFYFYTVKAPKIHRPSGRSINDKCPEVLPPGYVNINMSQVALNNLKTALSLTNPQWRWFTQAGNEDKFEPFYLAYMSDPTRNTPETKAFFKNALIQMMVNPGLNIDVIISKKSPAFIDLTSVSGYTPEEVKFREVYNILTQSPNYKHLFTNLFGVTNFINTKFKIENISQSGVAATCQLFSNSFGGLTNEIVVSRNTLLTNSNVNIATAIIHECIHAFLNVKLKHPNIGMSINNINNLNLQECINTYYDGFSGSQTQHDFFVDFLIPTISTILNDLKDELLTPQQINIAENPLYPNQCIYGVSSTIPATSNGQVVQWSWTNYFYNQSQVGLQNCTAFNVINPLNSSNYFNFRQYISLGTFLFAP